MLGPFSVVFPSTSVGTWVVSGASQPVPIWDAGVAGSSFTHSTRVPALGNPLSVHNCKYVIGKDVLLNTKEHLHQTLEILGTLNVQ